jgi:hypothetical protein
MKNVGIILCAILLIVFGAGCASKASDDISATHTSTPKETIAEGASVDKPASGLFSSAEVDPQLKNIEIESIGEGVSVGKIVFKDNRDFEDSDNWEIDALIKYDGSEPAYFYADFCTADNQVCESLVDGYDYLVLNKGDEKWLNYSFKSSGVKFSSEKVPVKIRTLSHKVVIPKVDPEFSDFHDVMISRNVRYNANAFVDIKSIKYVVKDKNKGWNSLVMEVSAGKKTVNANIVLLDEGGNIIYYEDRSSTSTEIRIPAGESKTVEIPLRTIAPEAIHRILIGAQVSSYK